jgi:glycosyltransferase involved in cell wall biosynthesis
MIDILKNKIYLIATKWTYPFGGGEEFMFDTMEWANEMGMTCYWVAFSDSFDRNFTKFETIQHKFGIIIHIPGGFSVEKFTNWLYLLRPDIVHHQGILREEFYLATEKMRLEFITGIHFWNGILKLHENDNKDINDHKELHKADPEFKCLIKKERCTFYSSSKFVRDTVENISGIYIEDIILSSSSKRRYFVDVCTKKYVTMINIHKKKGGNILFYLLKKCPNINFLCVRTERGSEDLDELIKNIIDERNNNPSKFAECIWMERTKDVKKIYSLARIVLCASIVDETFCRVVNESMMNGIPILTTHKGNIKYLVGNTTPVLDPNNNYEWEKMVNKLWNDELFYNKMSNKMLEQYSYSSENVAKEQFKKMITNRMLKGKEMSIGLFTPWCDQGLGIQSRNYYWMLRKISDFRLNVFALKPYNAESCQQLQKNKYEWEINDYIYYSNNTRENVKDSEIIDFCKNNNIGKMIIPETCLERIFKVSKLLRDIGVKVYAVPNIEIVRKNELHKHGYFHKILANNHLCESIFTKYLDIPIEYVGYGIDTTFLNIEMREKKFSDTINFLFIGGMNSLSRKNILDVCEGFVKAYRENKNIRLTATIQMINSLEINLISDIEIYKNHPGIKLIESHISYNDIINLYYDHHITLHLSKHEGLGLGFYESLSTGTPVLTLETQPHNEIIRDGINGWIIPCYYKKMNDNIDPLIDSAYFDTEDLKIKILEVIKNDKKTDCISNNTIKRVIKNLIIDYNERLHINFFKERFIRSII